MLSRSSLYLRLLLKDSTTTEGKRHVTTAPVKLAQPDNSLHKAHPDSLFAKAALNNLEETDTTLGSEEVTFHSQEDKCRVVIGLTAAKKQAPLLMHMECRVTLPDHDFVAAKSHKLIPSVIAAVEIKKECFTAPGVTYSGPTYISIWSAKHSSLTALSHLQDMKRVHQLPQFHDNMYTSNDLVKPIIITCDGGPDENPCYQKTISCAIDYFYSYDLDALFIRTNAPGRNAFNRVECRIASLSHNLAGIIFPHDDHGNHLDNQGKTIYVKLEQKNFAHTGSILAEIWSKTVIDKYEVVAEYICPEKAEYDEEQLIHKDWKWRKNHVCESQYMLQIVKCEDRNCCSIPRSSYFNLIIDSFLPPPLPLLSLIMDWQLI